MKSEYTFCAVDKDSKGHERPGRTLARSDATYVAMTAPVDGATVIDGGVTAAAHNVWVLG